MAEEAKLNEQINLSSDTKGTEKDGDGNESKETIEYKFDADLPVPQILNAESYYDAEALSNIYSVNTEFAFNLTVGDLQSGTIDYWNGAKLMKPTLCWFAMNKFPPNYTPKAYDRLKKPFYYRMKHDDKTIEADQPIRKLFVQMYVDRIVDIDEANETFRVMVRVCFRWLALHSEYKAYCDPDREHENTAILRDFPNVSFKNIIEEHSRKWERFHSRDFKMVGSFLNKSHAVIPNPGVVNEPDMHVDKDEDFGIYIIAQLECDVTLREAFELESFPFDCQDLPIVLVEKYGGVWMYLADVFAPFSQNSRSCDHFGVMDPSTSSTIEEWDAENIMVEIGGGPSCGTLPMIRTNIKLSRRWKPVLINALFVIFLLSTLSLTVFTISFEDTSSRLGVTLTLILTAVLFDRQSRRLYLTFVDNYFNATHFYLAILTFVTSFVGSYADVIDESIDNYIFAVFAAIYVMYNALFVAYGAHVRSNERKKLNMSWDELEQYSKQIQREKIAVSYQEGQRNKAGFLYSGTHIRA